MEQYANDLVRTSHGIKDLLIIGVEREIDRERDNNFIKAKSHLLTYCCTTFNEVCLVFIPVRK